MATATAVQEKVLFDSSIYEYDDYDIEEMMRKKVIGEIHGLIRRFEQRYRTRVEDIVLAGTLGTWRGNIHGGVVIERIEHLFHPFDRCDEVKVKLQDDTIVIEGVHHDGRNYMNIFLVTPGKRRSLGLPTNSSDWEYPEIRRIAKSSPALKADKIFKDQLAVA